MKTSNLLRNLLTALAAVFARPQVYDTYERALSIRKEEAETLLNTKRVVARRYLGNKHIASPNYRFDPRHSPDPGVYPHFREPYLNEVRDAAEVARSDNPAHLKRISYLFHLSTQRQTTQGA